MDFGRLINVPQRTRPERPQEGKGTVMATAREGKASLREEVQVRLELAELLENARAQSPYARNLSAAARAAGLSPSYLHKIEGAEVMASAAVYGKLCNLYGLPTGPVLMKVRKLDPSLRDGLLRRMDKLYEPLMALTELPDDRIAILADFIQELGTGKLDKVVPDLVGLPDEKIPLLVDFLQELRDEPADARATGHVEPPASD